MFLPAFQSNEISLDGRGDLLQLGLAQVLPINLQIDATDGHDAIAGRLRPFFGLLSFTIKNLSSHAVLLSPVKC